MKALRLILVVVLAALSLAGWAQYADRSGALNPIITNNIGIDDNRQHFVPMATEFTDETGKKVMLRDVFKDRPVILMPIFYNCQSACSLVFNAVLDFIRDVKKEQLGKDFDIVCISIHPKETYKDAAAKKKLIDDVVTNAIHKQGVDQGWRFLTGSWDSIHRVTDAVGFRYTYDAKLDKINHPAGIMILTKDGLISRYFYGVDYVPKTMVEALDTARANGIGPEAQKRLLGCLEYDPTKNSYKLVVMQALKVSCISTVVILIFSIVWMEFRRKQRLAPRVNQGGDAPAH